MSERSEIRFGTTRIPFRICRSDRRSTVALAIEGGGLVVTAPRIVEIDRLNDVVRSKALWVKQRLRSASALGPLPPREFVSGETFRYLGRQVRLRVIAGGSDGDLGGASEVKMDRGWLLVPADGSEDVEPAQLVRGALIRWYRRQAEQHLPQWVEPWAKKFTISVPPVLVRDQQRRWGSCNQAGEVRLNWRIIQAPRPLIDYVIAHELSHLVGGDDGHAPEFWARLGRAMPDYDLRRDRLRELGPQLEW
jgi:predicted metal-dependent hydrolase